MKIAHENYFYGVKELSKLEREIIYEMAIKNTAGAQRAANEGWLNLYCAPFDFAGKLTSLFNMGSYRTLGNREHSRV